MHYELTDLRLFFAIAEAQNLSAGAASLFMSASSASYRLKNLEKAMGTALFLRTPKGMELTSAGETALSYVTQVLATTDEMDSDISRFSYGERRNIRVLANSSSLNGFVTPVIGRFLSENPYINVQLEEMASQKIISSVIAGYAEIGIAASVADLSEVQAEVFTTDELVIVSSLDHPLANKNSVKLIDTIAHDFVSVERTSSNYLFLSSTVRQAGGRLNIRVYAIGFNSALRMVSEGIGIALVPRSVATKAIEERRVTAISLDESWAKRELAIVTPSNRESPEYVRSFVDFLLDSTRGTNPTEL
ncbi:LysR family transcriptional regulator [Corynebacterium sp. S7]